MVQLRFSPVSHTLHSHMIRETGFLQKPCLRCFSAEPQKQPTSMVKSTHLISTDMKEACGFFTLRWSRSSSFVTQNIFSHTLAHVVCSLELQGMFDKNSFSDTRLLQWHKVSNPETNPLTWLISALEACQKSPSTPPILNPVYFFNLSVMAVLIWEGFIH